MIDNTLIKVGWDEAHRIVMMTEEANSLIKRWIKFQQEAEAIERDESTQASTYWEAMLAKLDRNAQEDGVRLDKKGVPRDKDGFIRLVSKEYTPKKDAD